MTLDLVLAEGVSKGKEASFGDKIPNLMFIMI
jgi:hypothetical protein